MSSFVLRLSIILVLGLMVQSAPMHLTKRSPCEKDNVSVLEKRLYCSARDLYNANGKLNNNLSRLPEIVIDNAETNKTKKIAKEIYDLFSYRCQHFTKVMTLKHQLQYHLFNANTSTSYINENAERLSKVLTSLQTMANTFDDIEFNTGKKRCVKLTPAQYKIMTLLGSFIDDLGGWFTGFDRRLDDLRA